MGSATWTSFSKNHLVIAMAECQTCQEQRLTLMSQYAPIP